jgi:hypothetical protein
VFSFGAGYCYIIVRQKEPFEWNKVEWDRTPVSNVSPPPLQAIERGRWHTNLVIWCIMHSAQSDAVGSPVRAPNGDLPTFIWPLSSAAMRFPSAWPPCRLPLHDAYLNRDCRPVSLLADVWLHGAESSSRSQ